MKSCNPCYNGNVIHHILCNILICKDLRTIFLAKNASVMEKRVLRGAFFRILSAFQRVHMRDRLVRAKTYKLEI